MVWNSQPICQARKTSLIHKVTPIKAIQPQLKPFFKYRTEKKHKKKKWAVFRKEKCVTDVNSSG
jgi:hypothetical protein